MKRAVHDKDERAKERERAWETGSPLRNESAFPAMINLSARVLVQIILLRTQQCDMCMGWRIIFGGIEEKRRTACSEKPKMFTCCTQTYKRSFMHACEVQGRKRGEMTLTDDSSKEVGPQMWVYILKVSDKSVTHERWPAVIWLSWWKVIQSVIL